MGLLQCVADEVSDEWTLQSAHDGRELFARLGVEVVRFALRENRRRTRESRTRYGIELPSEGFITT